MSRRRTDYTTEFKEQILAECQQIGNVALVARRYGISASTIHTWRAAVKKRGSIEPLARPEAERLEEMARRMNEMGNEIDMLKKLVAEKELELAILRDLRDISNPR